VRTAGADVWKGRWVVVALDDGKFDGAFVAPSMGEVVDVLAGAAVIGADIPIGLPEAGERRRADELARAYVGPRWRSVFMTPPLEVLSAVTHAEANLIAAAGGRAKLPAQTYALRHHILEVDPIARDDGRLFEVHPEVSFARAQHGDHLRWSKSSWNGVQLRRRILDAQGIVLPDDLGASGAAGVADVLDAAIVAWSAARIASGIGESLPDRSGRIGAIWM
jgi:predicted RNase H-like nuclease